MGLYVYVFLLNSLLCAVYCIAPDADIRPPDILYPDAPLTLYRPKKFTIDCNATGIPKPSYEWRFGDKVVDMPGVASFSSTNGVLTFTDFTPREEGLYRCYASIYLDLASGRRAVTSVSPPLTIRSIGILPAATLPPSTLSVLEYDYIKIPCGSDQFTAVPETTEYNWYKDKINYQIALDDDRLFIDKQGDLHFTYLLPSDKILLNTTLKCGLSADPSSSITFGNQYDVQISGHQKVFSAYPRLQYKSEGTKGLLYKTAKLECFFSAYDPAQRLTFITLPLITWTMDDGTVIRNNDKYEVSADGRSLTIYNLVESDERNYYCRAKNNGRETQPYAVFLNVTSPPIFYENEAPRDVTVIQGGYVSIPCKARSALGELNPSLPIWFINGVRTDSQKVPANYNLKIYSLEITGMRKADDIVCVQCLVKNSEGELMGEACVNILADIRPPKILYPNAALTFYIGGESTIGCKATGFPQPSYEWKIGDKVVDMPDIVSFDSATGNLTFNYRDTIVEGQYRCYASSYLDLATGRQVVTSVSPPLTIRVNRLVIPKSLPEYTLTAKEYGYMRIPCESDLYTVVAETVYYGWYTEFHHHLHLDDGRLFIDKQGNLHYTYILRSDELVSHGFVRCGVAAVGSDLIYLRFGIRYPHLQVKSGDKVATQPQLRYKSDGTKGLLHNTAMLECFFSAYDPAQLSPLITWTMDDGTVIQSNDKYALSDDGRSVTVNNLVEADERNYYCKAKNTIGETLPYAVFLNVTTPPIFYENKAPREVTVNQGESVFIPCEARSAVNELNPSHPIWYINGLRTDTEKVPANYNLKTYSLEITGVRKPYDIVCVQCLVTNSEGVLMGEACVNVLDSP